ncbi:hypothetical protein TB2_026805 [Malus domestica]
MRTTDGRRSWFQVLGSSSSSSFLKAQTGPSKLHPSFSIFFTDPPVQKSRVPSGFHRRGERVGRRKGGVRKTQRKEGSSGEKSTVPFGDLVYERVSVASLEDVEQRYIHRKGKLKAFNDSTVSFLGNVLQSASMQGGVK